MRRLTLLPAAAMLLSGCVAGMVAGAASMAAGRGRSGQKPNKEFMQAAAQQACATHASQYGAVRITGITQKESGEIIVTGTIAEPTGKNSFECNFVTEVTGFTVQPVPPGN